MSFFHELIAVPQHIVLHQKVLQDCIKVLKPSVPELSVRKLLVTPFFVSPCPLFSVHLLYSQCHQAHPKAALLCLTSLLCELTSYKCAHRPSHCIDEIYITKCLRGSVFSSSEYYLESEWETDLPTYWLPIRTNFKRLPSQKKLGLPMKNWGWQ